MDGISIIEISNDVTLFEIKYLSDEIKNTIKDKLVEICQGQCAFNSKSIHYSFDKIIKELVQYRIKKRKSHIIGLVGELLLNVVIREFIDLKIISPFFNMEERSVKKGFDIIAIDSFKNIWIVESKAGEESNSKKISKTIVNKIKEAQNDLYNRLNQLNSSIWFNAINGAKVAMFGNNESIAIVNILEDYSNTCTSSDKNVVLGGTVFCLCDTNIDVSELHKLKSDVLKANQFCRFKLVAIHKKTFEAVIEYLYDLAK